MRKYIALIVIFISFILSMHLYADLGYRGSVVRIQQASSYRQLTVNEKPFFIKGVGCSIPASEKQLDKYFRLARQMGANSIRRWGAGANTALVLNKAHKYGLMINQGIWITSGPGFSSNAPYRESQKKQILQTVQKYKKYPALLLWNIGNENIENLNTKKDKEAFCKFLEDTVKEIHKIDPFHPVAYTGVCGNPLKLLKAYTPSLDIYGVNAYAGIKNFRRKWKGSAIQIPYLFSEYGPNGPWEVKKDKHSQPEEASDAEKARLYKQRWEHYIKRFKGTCLGGYAFLLESKDEGTKTWWGITYEALRKEAFWALYRLYTDKEPRNLPAKIKSFHISPSANVRGGRKIHIRIIADDPDNDTLVYNIDAPKIAGASLVKKSRGGRFEYTAPNYAGVYRLYAVVKDGKGNVATSSKVFQVR